MAFDAFAARLGDLEIFRGLAPATLSTIARAAERIVFRAGQPIITADSAGDAAYLLMGGEAVALDDDTSSGSTAKPVAEGSLVGEMAMLIEHDYAVTVVARTPVRAIRIPRETLHRMMAADPNLAQHFVDRIASRLTRVAVELRRIDQMLALAAEPPQQHA
ncbi:MAG: cyclic nucleotide-binding domain-containing protein [Hyphomicrobiaceae bacterium]